jgi:hypothetical protein
MLFDGEHADELEAIEDIPSRLGRSKLVWVDADGLSPEVAARLASALHVGNSLLELPRRPGTDGLSNARDFVRATLRTPERDGSADLTELTCVVGRSWIVTVHERPVGVLGELK